jgi:AraC-like DNA-binding protein
MSQKRIRLGDLSVGFAYALAEAVRAKGIDPAELLLRFGLDQSVFATPKARLSISRYMRLGHAAIQLTQTPTLGLDMGYHGHPAHWGLAGITCLHAPTVRHAASALLNFERLYGSNYRGQSRFDDHGDHAWLHFYSISPYNNYNRFVVDQVLSSWLRLLEITSGQPLRPSKVLIEYPEPSSKGRYEEQLGCSVTFGAATNAIRLEADTLATVGRNHFAGTWNYLLDACKAELQELTRLHSFSDRVAHLLGPLLKNGEPALEDIAKQLHIPVWTLRRKLADEGTRYLNILNNTRRDLAISYIRDTDLSLGEVAYVLGFASAAAFQRAFKRWTASTPGAFREAMRSRATL